jgi:hypothetical protein
MDDDTKVTKKRWWFVRCFVWCQDRLKDIFYDSTNNHLDHGRVAAFLSINTLIVATFWNMHLHQAIDLGPSGLGGGLGALLTAAVVYMYKDRQSS